jgi:ABC-type transport system involved in multi-copper enzyme maturation permease subunit
VKVLIVVLILIACLKTLSWGGSARFAVLGGFTTFFTGLFLTACFALDASRIFKREREQRTLSSLMMLPFSARRIAWEKAMGCIKTSWPAIAGFGISVTIFAFGFGQQIVAEIKRGRTVLDENAFYAVFITSHVVATMLMLPVFVAWLSLRLRWGALPLGGTIWFIGNWIGTALLALLMQEASVGRASARFRRPGCRLLEEYSKEARAARRGRIGAFFFE